MSYFYKSLGDCIASKQHLTSCDADGYCANCGEQEAEDVTAYAVPDVEDTKPYPITEEMRALFSCACMDPNCHDHEQVPVTPVFEGIFQEEVPKAPIFEPLPDQPYSDFIKFDIRTGTITKAEKIKKKDKLVHLEVWLGSDIGSRTIVAGIAQHFAVEQLIGIQVMVVTNLEPRKLGGFMSHGMILAGMGPNGLSLAGCMGVPDGCEIG